MSRPEQLNEISTSYLQRSYLAAAELPLGLQDEVPPCPVPLQTLEVPQPSLVHDLQATEE